MVRYVKCLKQPTTPLPCTRPGAFGTLTSRSTQPARRPVRADSAPPLPYNICSARIRRPPCRSDFTTASTRASDDRAAFSGHNLCVPVRRGRICPGQAALERPSRASTRRMPAEASSAAVQPACKAAWVGASEHASKAQGPIPVTFRWLASMAYQPTSPSRSGSPAAAVSAARARPRRSSEAEVEVADIARRYGAESDAPIGQSRRRGSADRPSGRFGAWPRASAGTRNHRKPIRRHGCPALHGLRRDDRRQLSALS